VEKRLKVQRADRLEEIKETLNAVKGLSKSGKLYDSALQDVDWLITEVERLRSIVEQHYVMMEGNEDVLDEKDATIGTLRETIRVIEHDKGSLHNRCCWCNELYPDHRDDCMRQKALAATEAPQ